MTDTGAVFARTGASDARHTGNAWLSPTNIYANDNTESVCSFAMGSGTSKYLRASNFGFAIPTGATIDGIVVTIGKKSATTDAANYIQDSHVLIVKADNTIGTTDYADTVTKWSTTETAFTYGGATDKWGETWNEASIEDSDFGVVLCVAGTQGDFEGTPTARVDYITITVYYTEGAGATAKPQYYYAQIQ